MPILRKAFSFSKPIQYDQEKDDVSLWTVILADPKNVLVDATGVMIDTARVTHTCRIPLFTTIFRDIMLTN